MFNLVGKTLSGFTGIVANKVGFETFFIFSASLGIPAIILTIIILVFGPDAAKGIRPNDPTNKSSPENENMIG